MRRGDRRRVNDEMRRREETTKHKGRRRDEGRKQEGRGEEKDEQRGSQKKMRRWKEWRKQGEDR